MLSNTMIEKLNKQINEELFSAYLYLSMANYCRSSGLNGCSNWFTAQAGEEMTHAMKIYTYIGSHQETAVLKAISEPKSQFSSVKEAFEDALKHEKHITSCISHLMESAHSEKDHATAVFLQWFVKEQVEEEESVSTVLDQLNLIDGSKGAMFALDKQLGKREIKFGSSEQ